MQCVGPLISLSLVDNHGPRESNQTGQMLNALADLPQATFASKVEVADG